MQLGIQAEKHEGRSRLTPSSPFRVTASLAASLVLTEACRPASLTPYSKARSDPSLSSLRQDHLCFLGAVGSVGRDRRHSRGGDSGLTCGVPGAAITSEGGGSGKRTRARVTVPCSHYHSDAACHGPFGILTAKREKTPLIAQATPWGLASRQSWSQVERRAHGEISGFRSSPSGDDRDEIPVMEPGSSTGEFNPAVTSDEQGVDEPPLVDEYAEQSRAAIKANEEAKLEAIDDPLDCVYAIMPGLQERLRDVYHKEGMGTGYEDVPVGFYRDSNLKPMNWRDAMVSMKPGSGTQGLDVEYDDSSVDGVDEERKAAVGSLKDKLEEAFLDGKWGTGGESSKELVERLGFDPADVSEEERTGMAIRRSYRRELREKLKSRVRTRYGGPAPGTHGPWRWSQLTPGSSFEQKLKAEIASFPRRLPKRLRRYFDDKVVWVTGADHGLGERLAINLTVNGAKVILSGMDLHELERVQRLCILAWMKAVDWDVPTAVLKGLTRLDRAMILPLDVRDDFILEYAAQEAEGMLDRPISMVFHCAGLSTREEAKIDAGAADAEGEDGEDGGGMKEDFLWGAAGLTKALLPNMLETQEGHVVVIGGQDAVIAPEDLSGEEKASRRALWGFFGDLRAEAARDNVKVTVVHPGPMKGQRSHHRQWFTPQNMKPRRQDGGTRPPPSLALDIDAVARRLLAAVSRGRREVVLERRMCWWLGWPGIGDGMRGQRTRAAYRERRQRSRSI